MNEKDEGSKKPENDKPEGTAAGKPGPGVAGGLARAAKLTPERRAEIAKKAGNTRWNTPARATHAGELKIGEVRLPCAVLRDGTRLLSQGAVSDALSLRPPRGVVVEGLGLMGSERLKPFVSEDLALWLKDPVPYTSAKGSGAAIGYRAEVLPGLCTALLAARRAGALHYTQERLAEKAEILLGGLAEVGLLALIDEATGYQKDRVRDELSKHLDLYLKRQMQPWQKTFPDEFYAGLFKLRGISAEGFLKSQRPGEFAQLTVDLVYNRMAPGLLDGVRKINPRGSTGAWKHKHFQHLSPDLGYIALREHLREVVVYMKLSKTWAEFMHAMDTNLPPKDGAFDFWVDTIRNRDGSKPAAPSLS